SRFLRLQARAAGDGTCNGLGLSFGIGISGLGRIGGTLRQRSRPDSRASNAANAPGKYGPAMQPDTPFVGHQFNMERYAFKFSSPLEASTSASTSRARPLQPDRPRSPRDILPRGSKLPSPFFSRAPAFFFTSQSRVLENERSFR